MNCFLPNLQVWFATRRYAHRQIYISIENTENPDAAVQPSTLAVSLPNTLSNSLQRKDLLVEESLFFRPNPG